MIISGSNVALAASHSYLSYHETSRNGVVTSATKKSGGSIAASLSISETSSRLAEHMKELKKLQEEKDKELQEKMASGWINTAQRTNHSGALPVNNAEQFQVALIRKLMEALNRGKKGNRGLESLKKEMTSNVRMNAMAGGQFTLSGVSNAGRNGSVINVGSRFVRQNVVSEFTAEAEATAFVGGGSVTTADGRQIEFQVSFEMSRSFMEQKVDIQKQEINLTDPLVINYSGDVAELTDQKFYFDLDADGSRERISFVGQGSGFLALDKDGNGKIDNGNELFGTKSGDGFKDLAAYDADKNGWIDEADDIFSKLKIWTKDKDGKDRLLNLKEAGVGAIYLGSAATEFSLKSADNSQTNGVVRSTGIFLKENGGAGTVQHIDLVS